MRRRAPMLKFAVLSAILCVPVGWGCRAVPTAETAPAAPGPAPQLVIIKAVYGDLPDGPTADVTAKLAGMIKDNTLAVEVSNDVFGDPAEGAGKKLRVDYTLGGVAHSRTLGEDETLSLPTEPKPLVGKLAVVKAVYGDLTSTDVIDVTAKVAAMVKDNALTVQATNDNFDDPASGRYKQLRVDYTIDGVARTKSVGENRTLTISGNAPAKSKKAAGGKR